ncbi:MAG: DUF2283 domain-containing protein [Nitrospirae bacterium]|nr:DUF2283 domain-containing protein [Nitrospirota bacterium]
MRLRYCEQTDAMYIRFKDTEIANTDEISDDIIIGYGNDGKVVGIEILSMSQKVDNPEIIIQSFGKVTVEASNL